jgi:hypothetical protein
MNLYQRYLLLFMLGILTGSVFGQKAALKDSVNALAVHQLSAYLSLSTQQEQSVFALEQERKKSMDSLASLSMGPDQRASALSVRLQLHFRQVKAIMTDVQWAKYIDMLAKRRAAFLKNASDKKIIVNELPGQNP